VFLYSTVRFLHFPYIWVLPLEIQGNVFKTPTTTELSKQWKNVHLEAIHLAAHLGIYFLASPCHERTESTLSFTGILSSQIVLDLQVYKIVVQYLFYTLQFTSLYALLPSLSDKTVI
jgi:hypothetical protein